MKNIYSLAGVIFLISCVDINSQIIENIGASRFHAMIEKEDGIIIDVRTQQEFYSGHIKDATNIDFYADDFTDKLKIIRKDVPIYIYCRSGGRSSSAANMMKELGFSKVYNLVGGIGTWVSSNYKTIKIKEWNKLNSPKFTISEIEKILKINEIVLINFSTQWCVPCKKMKPVVREIKEGNPNVKVIFIDADVNKEIIQKYQIQAVPVFIVFKNARIVFRHTGEISKEALLGQLD